MEVYRSLKNKELLIKEIEEKKALEDQGFLLLKVDRKNVRVLLDEILYIESLSDYIKVHTTQDAYVTKDKISAMEQSLPDNFIRIHRSFLINKHQVNSFNREEVSIGSQSLTIGRKYKNEAMSALEAGITVDSTKPH